MTAVDLATWLDVLACPVCLGELSFRAERLLACAACGRRFPVADEIPSLIPEGRSAGLERLSRRYRQARLDEGWRPMTDRQLLALPQGSPDGFPPLYWRVRRQTFGAFLALLRREGRVPQGSTAADLGAGTGWFAHRLARHGYRALAVEASLDGDFGLGASNSYRQSFPERFLAVQGDLNALPLRQTSCSLVIFNASLHYARNITETLGRAVDALGPGGWVVILDTPITRQARSGRGLGGRLLGREELDGALRAVGLTPQYVAVRRGLRWYAYQLRAAVRGGDWFSFPMVIGAEPAEGSDSGGH